MQAAQIEERLQQQFPGAKIKLTDLTGGGDHWQLVIEAEQFRGVGMLQQHRMIYKALGEWMQHEIHALSIDAKIPA